MEKKIVYIGREEREVDQEIWDKADDRKKSSSCPK